MYRAPTKRDGEGAPTNGGKVTEKLETRRQKLEGREKRAQSRMAGAPKAKMPG